MPSVVACPKCKTKYNVPDDMLGKVIKCQSCQVRFKTQGKNQGATPGQKQAGQQQRVATAASNQKSVEMARLGIDGPIQKAPDLFGGGPSPQFDPLANHVVVDPGFAEVEVRPQANEDTSEPNEYSEMYANPALSKRNLLSRVKVEYDENANYVIENSFKDQPFYAQYWFIILIVFSIAFISLAIAGNSNIEVGLAYINWVLVPYALCNIAINIWGIKQLHDCTQNSTQVLLAIIVPFYILVLIVRHWSYMKYYAYASIVMALLAPLAMIPIYIIWIATGLLGPR